MTIQLEGLEVVGYLAGENTVRDGALVKLSIERVATDPVINLTFEVPRGARTRIVKLELRDIQEFDFSFAVENPPTVIAFLKCLMTEAGEFYLSLDPWDDRQQAVSDKDNECFRSKFVRLVEE